MCVAYGKCEASLGYMRDCLRKTKFESSTTPTALVKLNRSPGPPAPNKVMQLGMGGGRSSREEGDQ